MLLSVFIITFINLLDLSFGVSFGVDQRGHCQSRTCPTRGWISYKRFECQTDCVNHPYDCSNEEFYIRQIDKMVEHNFPYYGYNMFVINCWAAKHRDLHTKELVADRERFPNGIKYIADYCRERGLKLGLWMNVDHCDPTDPEPSSQHHMKLDVETFAKWGVSSIHAWYSPADNSPIDKSHDQG